MVLINVMRCKCTEYFPKIKTFCLKVEKLWEKDYPTSRICC